MAVSRGWANRPCRNSGLAVPSSRIYFERSVLGLDANSFPTDVDERVANAWIWKRFSILFDFLLAFFGLINFPNRFVIAGPASVLLLRFVSPLIHFSPGECLCYVIVIVAGMVLKQLFGSAVSAFDLSAILADPHVAHCQCNNRFVFLTITTSAVWCNSMIGKQRGWWCKWMYKIISGRKALGWWGLSPDLSLSSGLCHDRCACMAGRKKT
jgi:hypothetical protein